MIDTYSTISAPAEGLYREKGSRFLSFAFPVQSEEEVKQRIAAVRQEHHSARHHCYAYRLGKEGALFRATDDGEPSGTGGKPILGQLLSANLTNVLLVVTRYFGGTLLGTSGLIAAYRSAAGAAIAGAQVVQRTWDVELTATFSYANLNEVMKLVKEEQLRVLRQDFRSEQCSICLSVRESKAQRVRERLNELGDAQAYKPGAE
ncbi:MAG: YigZ family protein [Prevotellaceae bacterium]|jgi:uncharacterized YigZ family protein|nr:YigZ family protein [Prevotellaceae bacterium]